MIHRRNAERYLRLVFFGGFTVAHGENYSMVSWIIPSFSARRFPLPCKRECPILTFCNENSLLQEDSTALLL